MTSQSENENSITVIQESSINESEKQPEELTSIDENKQKFEEKNNINDEEQKEITTNNPEDDNRSKRSFNSKVKYSSMPYHRSPYYTNGHPYGPAPYYDYQVPSVNEKPPPLMVIPTTTTTTDNQTGNSTTVSPQNLPPRLRQISTNENDSNVQQSSTSQSTTTNGRRHRSILPRGSCNYYSLHPPPPLMATPPGVLFPYPPTIHQTGHIAYNIRTPDELELLAFQQQFMNLSPPVIWPPPPTTAYPHFPSYSMYGPSPYMYNNSSPNNSNDSSLNPEAAEWVPIQTDTDISSSDNTILIDDEINFPPLNTNRIEENNCEQKLDINLNNNTDNNTKIDSIIIPNSSSSQDDNNKHLSSSSKLTTITYSTVILQTPDRNKSNKNSNNNNKPYQRQNHLSTKQRTQIRVSKDVSSRRRQPPSNRNIPSTEIPKQQQQQSTDDWIEVKSKKTKKFDRSLNDFSYENSSQKLVSDEQIHKTLSPPSSLSSIGDNTTATCTSEDEELSDNKLVMIVENKTITTTTDYNQIIVDDIHRKLDNGERLLIIMRGCPGSGKSTLAKSLNEGYNGQILSTDEYFKDVNLNEYLFDSSKLEKAHFYNRRLVSDAFKRNISPIILDNTNTTSWEMKPYVAMGKEAGYDILLIEPQTPWRYKARELVKRNLHNLPLRRIKEMLNRFEHNVTVQSIIDQIKTNIFLPCQSQQILDYQNQTDNELIDPILTSKKSFDIIDDSNILDDVRLCINDMILFLTSNFYQTSLLIPFSDLSLIPSSPTTPYSLFHRSSSRLSTTTNQDHSFSNEHILRLPTTTSFSRCFENLTPPSSTNSSIIGKKRRKNKNKQQSNEILLNTNNNNNNNISNQDDCYLQQSTYHVYLPEDSFDFIVIDEHDLQSITQQGNLFGDHSSTIPHQQNLTINKKNELLNIIHDELTKPTQRLSLSINHIAIQCSSNDFNQDINDDSNQILIGHSSSSSVISSPISIPPGYNECGIQVDLNENNIDSLSNLIEFYSDRLSSEIIKQFYEICNSDIQLSRTQIDEYLQHNHLISTIPTLRQLSFNALNQWNEEIKYLNPLFDTISIGDLLQDINDEELIETNNNNSIEFINSNQIIIPCSIIDSLQELYGELSPNSSFTNGLTLPLDDELSIDIYQALQRFLGLSNKITKPVNEKKITKEKKKLNKQQQQQQQQWISPSKNESNGPSLKQIMNEELNYMNTHKKTQTRQLDLASQYKLKELAQNFPTISSDVLYDIFSANESDYDLTFVCISSMLDETVSIATIPKSQPVITSNIRSTITKKSIVEPGLESYEIARRNARDYALKRKEYYNKADQANRHGMTGVASYYINQACEQTRLIKDANRLACEYISKTRLIQFHQTHQLDLHELHQDEALHLFQQVEQELNEGNRRTTPKSIEIITGYGKGSSYGGGTGKIRSVILAYLRQKNYKYSEPNKGAILVQL